MFDFIPQEYEKLFNIIFLTATALIAHHALTYRNSDGKKDFVRLLFGCICLLYTSPSPRDRTRSRMPSSA